MAFKTPTYSKKQINRAGDTLISSNATVQMETEALEVLNHWRSCHAYPINTFQATLRKRLSKVCTDGIIAQRLKRTPSILKKLRDNPSMRMARMQDIGGLRAITKTIHQVRKLEELYTDGSFQHEPVKKDDYISHPKCSGYRSLHLIYKYKNSKNDQYDGFNLELQLRTELQHAWATAVETIGAFLDQALKSSQGSEEWLRYFQVVSAAFSLLEDSPVLTEFSHLSKNEIFSQVISLTKRLNVEVQLKAFAIASDKITRGDMSGSYHLLTLNTSKKTINIRSFSKKRLDDANAEYAELESRTDDLDNIQVVLVATNSVKNLRRAYPNYFLDTSNFLTALEKIKEAKNLNS